jgi:hypothetical protein
VHTCLAGQCGELVEGTPDLCSIHSFCFGRPVTVSAETVSSWFADKCMLALTLRAS